MIFLNEIDLETHFSEAKITDLSELIGEKGGKKSVSPKHYLTQCLRDIMGL